eukprot:COSAG05_NODE_10536_length_560_cov_1.316703_1_plen_104_part_10
MVPVASGWLGEAEDLRMPELSRGTQHWPCVATPVGGALRYIEAGCRYFVELDGGVIPPLQPMLLQEQAERDLRRRACGYDILKHGGKRGKGGSRPTFVIEMDGL